MDPIHGASANGLQTSLNLSIVGIEQVQILPRQLDPNRGRGILANVMFDHGFDFEVLNLDTQKHAATDRDRLIYDLCPDVIWLLFQGGRQLLGPDAHRGCVLRFGTHRNR